MPKKRIEDIDSNYGSAGQIAARAGVCPTLISGLLYRGKIDGTRVIQQAGRKLIPLDLMPDIIEAIREHSRVEVGELQEVSK